MAPRKPKIQQQPLPVSGERVMMPPERSVLNKPPKAMTSSERRRATVARAQRSAWEQTPEGKARTTGYPKAEDASGVGPGMRHFLSSYDEPETPGPRHYDVQLPGMADPNAAPRPPKWEELNDANRAHTERALKLRGTSIEQMTSDIGAQLDQAHMRSQQFGEAPYASRFYERGSAQRDRISETASRLGVPGQIHAMSNAFTSPNTKFEIRRADGSTSYPNDEAAEHATRWVQQGGKADDITNELRTTGMAPADNPDRRAQGYTTNIRKAAKAIEQHQQGVAPADWRLGEGSKSPFDTSPKTGPYANSWNDSHPQFTVADVHTGGGGAFPHLGYEKSVQYDASGEVKTDKAGRPKRAKSERESALEQVPFAHSAVDYAMRQAMQQRNMGSVRRSQATQWGEEQLQRGEAGLRGAPRERDVYKGPQPRQEIEGQGSMLENMRGHDGVRRERINPEATPRARTGDSTKHRSSFASRLGLEF